MVADTVTQAEATVAEASQQLRAAVTQGTDVAADAEGAMAVEVTFTETTIYSLDLGDSSVNSDAIVSAVRGASCGALPATECTATETTRRRHMQSAAGGGSDTLQVVVRRTLGANDTLRGGAKDNAVMVGVQSVATVTNLTSQVATEATLEITQLGDTSEDVAAARTIVWDEPPLATSAHR